MTSQIDTIDSISRLSWRHYRIVGIAALGQLIGTTVATVAGIIIPLINIYYHPELSGSLQGLIAAADLIGICIGSVCIGRLSDKYGYLFFFRFCPLLICVFSIIAALIPNISILIISLFFMGVGIGGEYSLDSDYVSELMPIKYKSLMIGITKSASALGNVVAAIGSLLILKRCSHPDIWPNLLWIVSFISICMFISRIRFYESPQWLLSKCRAAEAQMALTKFLGTNYRINLSSQEKESELKGADQNLNLLQFIKINRRKIILSGIPWACEGLGVYGIGIFLPILVMALGLESSGNQLSPIFHVTESVKITLYISLIMLPGFITGLILINKNFSITNLQICGFLICFMSLIIILPSYLLKWNDLVARGAFMLFEFFLNVGPHLICYVLPARIYPVSERGRGMGIATAIGKLGAILAVFLIPILLNAAGCVGVLISSAVTMVIGAWITYKYRL